MSLQLVKNNSNNIEALVKETDLKKLRRDGKCFSVFKQLGASSIGNLYINNATADKIYYIYNIAFSFYDDSSTSRGAVSVVHYSSNNTGTGEPYLNMNGTAINADANITGYNATANGTSRTIYRLSCNVFGDSAIIDLQEEYIQINPGQSIRFEYADLTGNPLAQVSVRWIEELSTTPL